MPLLLLGLTTDIPRNQGHAPDSSRLLFPGAGRSGNGPGVFPLPREPAVRLELSFPFAPQTESLSHPQHQTLHKAQPEHCFYFERSLKSEASPCRFSKLTFNLQLFLQTEGCRVPWFA